MFSSSSTVPPLFGERRADYEADMREILAQASPSGRFSVRLPDNILRIWRLPALLAGLRVDDGGDQAGADVVDVPGDADIGRDLLRP